jgi:hypothetical protein
VKNIRLKIITADRWVDVFNKETGSRPEYFDPPFDIRKFFLRIQEDVIEKYERQQHEKTPKTVQ